MKQCVRCGIEMVSDPVPCPDGQTGCCVLHYGLVCPKCNGQVYESVHDSV